MGTDDGLRPEPATAAAEVIERMEGIQAAVGEKDGLSYFNEAYLTVTRGIVDELDDHGFEDNAFMDALVVHFANLYLVSVHSASTTRDKVLHCWRPILLEHRTDPGPSAAQFVYSGLNAHLAHDLPVAVVTTCKQLETDPNNEPHHRDFLRINDVVRDATDEVRRAFLKRAGKPSKDAETGIFERWSIERARDASWAASQALWAVQSMPWIAERIEDTLDRSAGLVSRLLLFRP